MTVGDHLASFFDFQCRVKVINWRDMSVTDAAYI